MRFSLLIVAVFVLLSLAACEVPVTQISHTTVTVTEMETGVNEVKVYKIDRADSEKSFRSVLRDKYEAFQVCKVENKTFTFELEDVPSDQCIYFFTSDKEGKGEALAISTTYWTAPEFRFKEGQTTLRWDKLLFPENRKTNKNK